MSECSEICTAKAFPSETSRSLNSYRSLAAEITLVGVDDPMVVKKIVADEVRQCLLRFAADDGKMEITYESEIDDENDRGVNAGVKVQRVAGRSKSATLH